MDRTRLQRLCQRAQSDRWKVPPEVFSNALERSAEKAFSGKTPTETELDRYFDSLHLADLALACACAMGREDAWDHFVREFRPGMYRSADAIDPSGAAREVAQALYAELFGLKERDGIRQSVFRYFHGRSSLATWLRSLIAQRFGDRHRETRRLEPLSEDEPAAPPRAASRADEPDRHRYVAAMRAALAAALAALAPRDRMRIACYYAQEMTLAQIARLTREHEATVSRQLARTRRDIRNDVEERLQQEHGYSKPEVEECFASLVDDAGDLDLADWLDTGRKKSADDRSMTEATEHADRGPS